MTVNCYGFEAVDIYIVGETIISEKTNYQRPRHENMNSSLEIIS